MAIRTGSFFDGEEDEGEDGEDEEEEADEDKGEEEEEEAMGDLNFRNVLEAAEEAELELELEVEERTWWQTMIWEWVDTLVLVLMNR